MEILVYTKKDKCHHCYQQVGRAFTRKKKSFLYAHFVCKHCKKERDFAIAMTGYWSFWKRMEGLDYV